MWLCASGALYQSLGFRFFVTAGFYLKSVSLCPKKKTDWFLEHKHWIFNKTGEKYCWHLHISQKIHGHGSGNQLLVFRHGCPRSQFQVSICGTYGAESGTGAGLTQSTFIFPSASFCLCSTFIHSLVTDVTQSEQLRVSLNTVLKKEKNSDYKKGFRES